MNRRRDRATTVRQPTSFSLVHRRWRNLHRAHSLWFLGCFVAIIGSLYQTGIFHRDLVNEDGWTLVVQFLQASLHPDLSGEFLQIVTDATLKTLAFAVCGTALSLTIGTVGGIFASEVWWRSLFSPSGDRHSILTHPAKTPWVAVRSILAVPRAIHEIIWGLFFVNIFGLDPLVAILAIAIPFGAIVAKVFSEILDETPREPLLALLNAGVHPLSAFLYSLIPQAFTNLLSYVFYRFECSIRSAAVLGIIGAGGLGYEIFLSLQSLHYEQMWTLFWALVLLNGSIDFWSALLRGRIGAPNRLDLNLLKLARKQRGTRTPSFSANETPLDGLLRSRSSFRNGDLIIQVSIAVAIVLLPFSFGYVKADFTKLWSPRTALLLAEIVRDSIPPDFTELGPLFYLAGQTLAMSILAIAVAGLGGILLSFPAAFEGKKFQQTHSIDSTKFAIFQAFKGQKKTISVVLTRIFLLIMRAIPAPVWALIFLYVLFPGILPGAIALGVYNLGILGRLMAEVIENLDKRPAQAIEAIGARQSLVFLYGILPRTLPGFLAYILYRWEVCIRETAIVGLVGTGGLGRLLTEQLSSFDYPAVLTTLMFFLGLTVLVDFISGSVRRSLR